MRSNLLVVASAAAAVLLMASCSSAPKKTDAGDGANVSGNAAPVISNEAITTDPQGSDSGKINGLSTIFFDYDKANLSKDATKKLGQNAEWIKTNSQFTVQVEGHTDERGSVEYNLALGERRAKSVKAYLANMGIPEARVTIISYGEEKPLDPGHTEGAWSKNRRANFVPLR